ncbi:MAG: hypothetical protein K6T83_14315 [Alicyclobacillus sp.]|nr:hypothetical protein [Alicyclobacillus sp.]
MEWVDEIERRWMAKTSRIDVLSIQPDIAKLIAAVRAFEVVMQAIMDLNDQDCTLADAKWIVGPELQKLQRGEFGEGDA